MNLARARPSPWRSVALVGALAGVAALLWLHRPATDRKEGDVRRLLDALDHLSLVVPNASSGVAPFFVDRCEVTNEEYAAFIVATGFRPESATRFLEELRVGDEFRVSEELATRPVAFVSASDAEAFASWRGGRLPTHAEWSELVGAAVHSAFEPRGTFSRYRHNLRETGLERTARVGTFESGKTNRRSSVIAPPVYDLVGNVAEWVRSSASDDVDYAVFGGSFRDSTDRALDRFFGVIAAADRRSDEIGFRCVLPDATALARRLLVALTQCDEATFREAISRLRKFNVPLERLIEAIRFADARIGETPLDPPFAIRDVLHDLGGGRILRMQRSRDAATSRGDATAPWIAELIDSERGAVNSVGIGAIRGEPYLEFGADRDRILFASQDRARAESGSRLHLSIVDDDVAILDLTTKGVLAPLPELPVFRVPGFARNLPRCVATEPASCSFSACPSTATGITIDELTVEGDRITLRRIASVTAAEDLHASRVDSRVFAFGTIGLVWPEFDPNCIGLPSVIAAGYALSDGERIASRALLLPDGDVPPQRSDDRSDRILVFSSDGTMGIVEGFAAGVPRWTPARFRSDRDLRFVSSLSGPEGAIVEATDRAQERLILFRLDRAGRLRATREIENAGTRRSRLVRLRDGALLLFDSEGAIHRLDSELRSIFATTGRAYAPDIAIPALVDFDRDGDFEVAVAASHESLARLDLRTGEELDRWSLDDRTILALASPSATTPECGLLLAMNDRGAVKLRAGSTRVDAVGRRLSRGLLEDRASGSEP